MTDLLREIHPWIGYLVTLVVVISFFQASGRAKDRREFVARPYALAMVLIDVQVLLGFVVYALVGAWDLRAEIAYVHPILALAALAVGHALLGRARKQQMAADAHRTAGRGLLAALVLVLAAIGVASAPPFL